MLANTTSDLIGGLFNFSAALYYTSQVFRVSATIRVWARSTQPETESVQLSGRKVWLFALVMFLNTGTFILTLM